MRPQTIGMVLKGYPRISETFISNEIRFLERLGYRIHIISMRKPRESFTHASVQEIRAGVDYLPEQISGALPGLLADAARAFLRHPLNFARGLGHCLSRFAATRKSATLKHFLQGCRIAARIAPKAGITHLHAHFAHSPASVARFAALLCGIPFSFTAHAKDIWTQKPDSLADKLAAARFVVTCTRHNRAYLESLNRAHTPLDTVYHGIDLTLFSPAGAAARRPAPPYAILTVARMTTKKGLPGIIDALALLRDQGVDFVWTLIGDGDDRKAVRAKIEASGLGDRTRLLGVKPHDVVQAEMAAADLFVLGCVVAPDGDRDGIPNVLAEAMAMGVPVVATTVSGIPELVQDGVSGLLVEPGDARAMAAAMTRLLTDQNLRDHVIPAAMAKVRADFDASRLIVRLAEVYARHGLGPSV